MKNKNSRTSAVKRVTVNKNSNMYKYMLETRNNEKSFEFLSETENSNTGENF